MARTNISKQSEWPAGRHAIAPYELMAADCLSATTKLLWIFLNGQVDRDEIERGAIDRGLNINRSTRLRCLKELIAYGFVSGTEANIVINNPFPILKKMKEERRIAMEYLEEHFFNDKEDESIDQPKATKPRKQNNLDSVSNLILATTAWNNYRPKDYSKINRMSSQLLKSIHLHMDALGIKRNDYEQFFSTLKNGIEHSKFWSKENSSKTLQSIVGVGQPQFKKYQNVFSLYNEGLNFDKAEPIAEEERVDQVILPNRLRKMIDKYDELQYTYMTMEKERPEHLHILNEEILQIEEKFRQENLDPAKFRMAYPIRSWPSDVPLPEKPREEFWIYDNELE